MYAIGLYYELLASKPTPNPSQADGGLTEKNTPLPPPRRGVNCQLSIRKPAPRRRMNTSLPPLRRPFECAQNRVQGRLFKGGNTPRPPLKGGICRYLTQHETDGRVLAGGVYQVDGDASGPAV